MEFSVENSTLLVELKPTIRLDYMPIALTTELWECDTFQDPVWDTGSGYIHI